MKLFEIDEKIESCIDQETGEINEELYNEYSKLREEKIENLICLYKNICSDVDALKYQEKCFEERRKAEERKAEKLKEFIAYALNGEKMKTARAEVTYRKSKAVYVHDDFVRWAEHNGRTELLTYKEPVPDKTFIKNAILAGEDIPAELIENINIQIK